MIYTYYDRNASLAARGQDILRTLGRVRERVPMFEFSLTW